MSGPQPLSTVTIDAEEIRADRRKSRKFDQCGLGEKAIYIGGFLTPRKFYVPYSQVTHVFKRVAVSKGSGKAFLTPILYLVVRYDDGKEKQCSFRYLNEADDMLTELERTHPEISLKKPGSEAEEKEKAERLQRLDSVVLEGEAARAVRKLENAKEILNKRPGLCKELIARARIKRSCDLIRPGWQILAAAILAAGICCIVGSVFGLRAGLSKTAAILLILIGAAAVLMMVNSRILPTPGRNRRSAEKTWEKALDSMQHHINSYPGFPLPARYAHPVVCDRMIRILKEERASDLDGALTVLKQDLKQMDYSVQLDRQDYEEVIQIKPLFLVSDYR
ncbi:MAG: ATPase P [Bilifractor sp.]|jgi:hypothetical protein